MELSEYTALDSDTLAELTRINDANLVHTCLVRRQHRVGGGPGGMSPPAADDVLLPAGTPCRLAPFGTRIHEAIEQGQLHSGARWNLTLHAGTVLPDQAQAVVDGAYPDGTPWQRTVTIVVGQTTKAWATLSRYECVDVTPAGR